MSYRAWFQCINAQCGATYPLNSIVYQCQQCHSLLEVQHELAALARRGAAAWMKLFEDRYKSNEWPYGSGVWGKKEWILPQISDNNVVSLYEGGTNLFWAERFGKVLGVEDLWIKLCGNTHSGSFKDLGMTVLVSQVKQMIWIEPLLGRALRQGPRGGGPVDQAVRQHAQRVIQGSRHDGAGLAGQTDDLGGGADQGGGVRLDGGHLGGAGNVLCGRRHPIRGAAAAGQDFHRATGAADFQ